MQARQGKRSWAGSDPASTVVPTHSHLLHAPTRARVRNAPAHPTTRAPLPSAACCARCEWTLGTASCRMGRGPRAATSAALRTPLTGKLSWVAGSAVLRLAGPPTICRCAVALRWLPVTVREHPALPVTPRCAQNPLTHPPMHTHTPLAVQHGQLLAHGAGQGARGAHRAGFPLGRGAAEPAALARGGSRRVGAGAGEWGRCQPASQPAS